MMGFDFSNDEVSIGGSADQTLPFKSKRYEVKD